MSVGGPSGLGTLLVQRLDAVLGTTLSQQANLATGARPDAVTQAANPEQAHAARNETLRHPREAVDRAASQAGQQGRQSVDKAKLDARAAELLQARNAPNTAFTPSAPTTLGRAARTILALLTLYGDQPAAVQGRRPLLGGQGQAGAGTDPAGAARQNEIASASRAQAGAPGGAEAGSAKGAGPGGGAEGPGAPSSAAAGARGPAAMAQAPAGSVAGQLAQSLAQALQSSGMFYESHLNLLATGRMTAEQLMREPQALAGRAEPGATAAPAGEAAAKGAGANEAGAQAGAARGGDPAQAAAAPPGSSLAGLDPQTHLLVRQQLEVLANQAFAWRGEAWPGTPMEWEVGRREEPAEAGAEAGANWATRIAIQLPRLGQVEARLTLSGQQLVMHVVAPESAGTLDEAAEALRGRYAAQGLTLSRLSIAAADTTGGLEPKPLEYPFTPSEGRP
ncbi:hypothetical protein HNQ49_000036 [Parapusillimonas granuli]|nr:flagellar hook-length control protein FliK [Parapusillimonas granuli]MBB5213370.1 hypothetical protein [Parapusillimonas granuli]